MGRRRVISVAAGMFAVASLAACGVQPSEAAAAAVQPVGSAWFVTSADDQAASSAPAPSTGVTARPASGSTYAASDQPPVRHAASVPASLPVRPASPVRLASSVRLPSPVRAEAATSDPSTVTDCPAQTLTVVAHEDDDLLFINPSVSNDIAAGRCVTTVFVTAGDSGRPRSYWEGREEGSMSAYSTAAGLPDEWTRDTVVAAGHSMTRYTLQDSKVQLIFMRLPDAHGNQFGRPAMGLQKLWLGQLASLRTVDNHDTFTKTSLIATLTSLMDTYQPDEIRTLDFAGHYGDGDHADHHTVGYLTDAAQSAYPLPHETVAYMGYPVANQPANLSDDVRDAKLNDFLAYASHDAKVCQTSDECLSNFYAPRFDHTIETADLVSP